MGRLLTLSSASLFVWSLAAGASGGLRAQAPDAPAGDTASETAAAAETKADNNAAVKVFATIRGLEPLKPWTRASPRDVSGSGVVIEGNRILTNAHVVLYAGQIQVQANDSDAKISAKVEAIAPGIDLAILKLTDETLFAAHHPLPRSHTLPNMRDAVTVYGFPTGGTSISLSKGIVSRIEYTAYNYPASGLRIQIDAAINPGNSGGPAMVGDQMIGLAFSRVKEAQNIGYIIPCEEIELFLKAVAQGAYRGKPALYDEFQPLQNPALRRFLKLDPSVQGVVVHEPNSRDPAYPLKRWDVMTQIAGVPIDDEGMVKIGNLRLNYRYVVQAKGKEDSIPVTLLRAGKAITVVVPLARERPMLIYDLQGAPVPYFIFGPLTFAPATVELLAPLLRAPQAANLLSAAGNPLFTRRADRPEFPGEQLVVISAAPFPSPLMQGYPKPELAVVKSVNGTPIRSLRQLVEFLRDSRDDFIVFEFASPNQSSLVLARQEALDATNDILSDNGVRAQGSPELMKVWNAPAAK